MTLTTLADVRELVERHLPAERRALDTWRHVPDQLAEAARGGDINDVVVSLRPMRPPVKPVPDRRLTAPRRKSATAESRGFSRLTTI
jgi:hypothetical protein